MHLHSYSLYKRQPACPVWAPHLTLRSFLWPRCVNVCTSVLPPENTENTLHGTRIISNHFTCQHNTIITRFRHNFFCRLCKFSDPWNIPAAPQPARVRSPQVGKLRYIVSSTSVLVDEVDGLYLHQHRYSAFLHNDTLCITHTRKHTKTPCITH